jgi:hypothetical protein
MYDVAVGGTFTVDRLTFKTICVEGGACIHEGDFHLRIVRYEAKGYSLIKYGRTSSTDFLKG